MQRCLWTQSANGALYILKRYSGFIEKGTFTKNQSSNHYSLH